MKGPRHKSGAVATRCMPGSDCVTVTDTFPDPIDAVLYEFYLSQLLPGNTFQYVGPPGFKLKPLPPPKPTPPGLQVSTTRLIRDFNQCAANVADKYSAASLLHLNNSKVGNALLGSTTAAISNLVFQTNPKVYVPAGVNLAASAKAGAALKGTAVALGKVEINQGFQSVFTTVGPTTVEQTVAGGTALNGVKGLADFVDAAAPVLIGYDEALYGIGEGVCAAQSF